MIEMYKVHEKICEYFKVEYMYPFNRSRKRKTVYVRQLFHYLCKELNHTKISHEEIGNYLSDISEPFERGTVMNSIRKIEGYLSYDKYVKRDVDLITEKILKDYE